MSADKVVNGLQKGLRTKRFGKRIFFSREINSTNDLAKELARLGAEEGTIVLAQTQKAGRGRFGREWVSPRGGLWFSAILRPNKKAMETSGLVFVAGLSVAEVLHEKYGLRSETKWPNDVLVNGKKLCGVLAEINTEGGRINYAILGVGVNVNFRVSNALPEPLRSRATSVESELGRRIRLQSLIKTLLEKMESVYDDWLKAGSVHLLRRWKEHAAFLGCKVVVTDESRSLEGLALDVDVDGALVLKLDDGTTRRILVGDVVVCRP